MKNCLILTGLFFVFLIVSRQPVSSARRMRAFAAPVMGKIKARAANATFPG